MGWAMFPAVAGSCFRTKTTAIFEPIRMFGKISISLILESGFEFRVVSRSAAGIAQRLNSFRVPQESSARVNPDRSTDQNSSLPRQAFRASVKAIPRVVMCVCAISQLGTTIANGAYLPRLKSNTFPLFSEYLNSSRVPLSQQSRCG